MLTLTSTEIIDKLATIGQSIMLEESLPLVTALRMVAKYVTDCSNAFNLTPDETASLQYLIVRMK